MLPGIINYTEDELITILHGQIYPEVYQELKSKNFKPFEVTDNTIYCASMSGLDSVVYASVHRVKWFTKNPNGQITSCLYDRIDPINLKKSVKETWFYMEKDIQNCMFSRLDQYLSKINPEANIRSQRAYSLNSYTKLRKALRKCSKSIMARCNPNGYDPQKYIFGQLVQWFGTETYRKALAIRGMNFTATTLNALNEQEIENKPSNITLLAFRKLEDNPLTKNLDKTISFIKSQLTDNELRILSLLSPKFIKDTRYERTIDLLKRFDPKATEVPSYTVCRVLSKHLIDTTLATERSIAARKSRKLTQKEVAWQLTIAHPGTRFYMGDYEPYA